MKVLDHGFVELVESPQHAGINTVRAARCSYGKAVDDFGDDDERLVKYLLKHGHTSPFRHAMFTFHVKAPLFTFRQWWKYQVGSTWREYEFQQEPNVRGNHEAYDIMIDTDQGCSWNELSGRYKKLEPEFYWPEQARHNIGKQESCPTADRQRTEEMRDRMDRCYVFCMANYQAMLDAGVAKELARIVLPPAIYSECYWTVSLQAVMHFLDQRLKPDAQFEIREYAKAVLELLRPTLADMGILPNA